MKRLLAVALLLLFGGTAQAADYTVVVFDASGSMAYDMGGSTRMIVAKRALSRALGNLPASSYLGIVVFQDGLPDPWVYPLSPYDKAKVLHAVQVPQPNGGTPLGEYMKIGADVLLKTREANHNQGNYKLIVVTDGEAQDIDQVTTFNQDIRSRGIVVNVIGVGMNADHSLANRVDFYQNAADETALNKALALVLAETPDTADKPTDFIEGKLDPRVAQAAMEQLSLFRNQPIGEKPPIKTVDAAGNTSYVPAPAAPVEGGGMTGWILGGIVVVFLIIGVLAVAAKNLS